MSRSLTALFLLFWAGIAFAQSTATLNGRITDRQTGEVLPGATILLTRDRGTVSDQEGNFSIVMAAGNYTLSIQYVGYSSISRPLNLRAGELLTLNFALEPELTEMEQVIVSAGRVEQRVAESTVSVSIIKPKALQSEHITDPTELLNKQPGIEVLDGQASMRGGSGFAYGAGSRVMALVDGLPMVSPDVGSIRWSALPLENLSQIEIIKGASSVLYGSSALNGIINFRTAEASSRGSTSFFAEAGIFDKPRQQNWVWWDSPRILSNYSFSHLKKYGDTDFGAGAFFQSDPGYRKRNDETSGRMNLMVKHHNQKMEGLTYGLQANFLMNDKTDFVLWENAETGALVHDTSTATRLNATILVLDPTISFKRSGHFSHDVRMRYQFLNNRFPSGNQIDSQAQSLFAEYQVWYNISPLVNLNAGLVQQSNTIRSNFYGDHESLNLAAYVQSDFSPTERLKLVGGLRLEFNSLNGLSDKLVPLFRAGINYRLTELTFLRGSFGQGYRYPSIAEKFAATTLGAVRIFPNPTLNPESGWNAELGLKQGILTEKLDGLVDLALFYTRNKDMIEFLFGLYPDPYSGEFGLGFQANNTENSRVYGMELEFMLNTRLGRFNYSINGGYVFMYPTEFNPYTLKDTGTLLKYRRKHSAKLSLSTSLHRYELGLHLFARSRILNIDDVFVNELTREAILPGFYDYWLDNNRGHFLADLSLGYRISANYAISLAIKNLTNAEYMGRPGDIQPQRHFSLRFSGKF
ncbi:MAG: TonB-dependent receptor [Bacteroidales bacterium]|nr:TonB-dependent receptor [Bacteroidales bacterium]